MCLHAICLCLNVFTNYSVNFDDFLNFSAHVRSHSAKKHRNINKNALIEEEENGYVQILIKKDHLEELQSILTIHRKSTDISQNEITSLCGILADCGILNNKEN